MGDEAEYGSFANFQAHNHRTALEDLENGATVYTSGDDTLAANRDSFTVNGVDPYAYAEEKKLWQDTPLTQMGRARLEKNGAVIERGSSWANMFLHTFPKQRTYVAMNLLPDYLTYSFTDPGGVRIIADGSLSMGRWAVKDSREIDIKYHAFGGKYLPKEDRIPPATVLFATGTRGKPAVTLNREKVTPKPYTHNGVTGWLVPLGTEIPANDVLAERFDAATAK